MVKKETEAPINLDIAIKRLEEIANKIGNHSIGIEESIKLYEEGMELKERCKLRLEEMKIKIEKINNK